MREEGGSGHQKERVPEGGVALRLGPGPTGDQGSSSQQRPPKSLSALIEERIKPYLELAVGIAAIIGLVVVYKQLDAMKETNEITRQSNIESDETTRRTLALMEESNRLTREALRESKRQAEASRDQSAKDAAASRWQSASDARTSLEIAKEAMRRSEIPWVNIEKVALVIVPGSGLQIQVAARNVGRTPAEAPHRVCAVALSRKTATDFTPMGAESTILAPLGPGQIYAFDCLFPISDSTLREIKESSDLLTVFVEVVYKDPFSRRQVAVACYRYDGPNDRLIPCEQKTTERMLKGTIEEP